MPDTSLGEIPAIDKSKYTSASVDEAVKWRNDTGYIIITPTASLEDLEDLWNQYNEMILKYRIVSDWKSQELFGLTNKQHYEYLKYIFLKSDVDKTELTDPEMNESYNTYDKMKAYRRYLEVLIENNEPASTIGNAIFKIRKRCNNIYEDAVLSNIVSDVCDKYDSGCVEYSPEHYMSDIPMLSPEDMEDAGVLSSDPEKNYFGVEGDNSVVSEEERKKWFNKYKSYWESYKVIPKNNDRINWIRKLLAESSMLEDKSSIEYKAKQQAVLELGWTPWIKFDYKNRSANDYYYKLLRNNSIPRINKIDMRSISIPKLNLSEDTIIEGVHPVYIIVAYYKEDNHFDSVGYSFDPYMNEIYLPVLETINGGLRKRDLLGSFKDENIDVYTVFLGDTSYDKLKDIMENDFEFQKSYAGIMEIVSVQTSNHIDIAYMVLQSILKFIPDKKIENYDVSYDDNRSRKDGVYTIYSIYDGFVSEYNPEECSNRINAIMTKYAKRDLNITESVEDTNPEDDLVIENFCKYNTKRDAILNEAYETFISPIAKTLGIKETLITNEGFEITSDLTELDSLFEASSSDKVPVFIVLFQGKAPWSPLIAKFTNTVYSHASLGFDRNLKTLYTFAIAPDKHGNLKKGFVEENLNFYSKMDVDIGVFAMMITREASIQMHKFIDSIKKNMQKTQYNIEGLFRFLIHMPKSYDYKMFCSEFCDKILKSAGIDLTGIETSALVSPGDFERAAKGENAKLYELYTGKCKDYRFKFISKKLELLKVKDNNEIN